MVQHEIPLLKRLMLAALCTALPALDVAVDASLHVYDAVQRELCLGLTASRQLPAQDNDELVMICQSGTQVSARRGYWGVRPSNVLDQAGLDIPGHQDTRCNCVVAHSSRDGYAVVFSWDELYSSEAGDEILVAYQKNGLALDPGEGPLALASTSGLRSGPCHAKWLGGLEVVRLP